MIHKLGIDFGTSFCSICALTPEGAKVIKFDGEDKIPTAIFWDRNDNVHFGDAAFNRLERLPQDSKDNSRYIASVKTELINNRPIILPDKEIMPVDAMAKVLSFLIKKGESFFNGAVDEVTLTCPATFEKAQFDLYKEALELAGVNNYTLTEDRTFLREPVAAALARFNDAQLKNGVLVYDLGGGTFDLAYIYRGDDGLWSIPVKPTGIKKDCAGDYFDKLIYDEAKRQIKELQTRFNKENRYNRLILTHCRDLKESLSKRDSDERQLVSGKKGHFKLTRIEFENLIRDNLEATMKKTEAYLKDVQAAMQERVLDNMSVLLIGGSTEIPLVKTMLDKTLKKVIGENCDVEAIHPSSNDTAVAEGAAIYFPDVDNLQSTIEFGENQILSQADWSGRFSPQNNSKIKKCPNCGASLLAESGICYSCGELCDNMLPPLIKNNPQIREKIRKKIKKLCSKLKNVFPPPRTRWSMPSARYARAIERIKQLISIEDSKVNNDNKKLSNMIHIEDWNRVESLCSNCEFHIALVGTVKAGKSTLLNAILGNDGLATTSVTPETATLTKFRVSKSNILSIKTTFYSKEEWNSFWADIEKAENGNSQESHNSEKLQELSTNAFKENYNKCNAESVKNEYLGKAPSSYIYKNIEELKEGLTRWTSSKCKEHFFVKEVEVSLNKDIMPDSLKNISSDIVFIDTPGLHDVVNYRSNITKEYLKNAHVVLACIAKDNITNDAAKDICTIFSSCKYPERVYIIGTKIDGFDFPEQDWKEQKDYWVNILKDDCFYGDESVAQKRIFGVSARVVNTFKDCYQNRGNNRDWFEDFLGLAKSLGIIESHREGLDCPERFEPDGDAAKRIMEFANIDNLINNIQEDFIQRYKYLLLQDIQNEFSNCLSELIQWTSNYEMVKKRVLDNASGKYGDLTKKQNELQQRLNSIKKKNEKFQKDFEDNKVKFNKRLSELKKALLGK